MKENITIVWFRRDLRLRDNPAIAEAAARGRVVPVYIHAPGEEAPWEPGAASRWWLHHSLESLRGDLRTRGSELLMRTGGSSLASLQQIVQETGASAIYWNRLYEPALVARDTAIKQALRGAGVEARSFGGYLLHEPTELRNQQGKPFQVFTHFWKHVLSRDEPPEPREVPELLSPEAWPKSVALEELALLSGKEMDGRLGKAWRTGEGAAREKLEEFLQGIIGAYDKTRDMPGMDGTSRLSPHLHFGELSVRSVWHEVKSRRSTMRGAEAESADAFLRQIGWREFSAHLLFHFPTTTDQPLKEQFSRFPWEPNEEKLALWKRGETGFPIVDAGMRQLSQTGWMHNRVRMIVASFLVKDLLIPWQVGARFFWETLVDADLANNTMGWQWAAGCGADASPFFRVFNPTSQAAKHDPDGEYIRKWIPELAGLRGKALFAPWEGKKGELESAGIVLDEIYPLPIVDHAEARENALAAYEMVKKKSS